MADLGSKTLKLSIQPCLQSRRSIHQAKGVIEKGICWRIGDGRSVWIWEDPWLPKQNGSKGKDVTWKKVWKRKIPPRVANFIWRTLHYSLPTKKKSLTKGLARITTVHQMLERGRN
ncbi:hypothetical protein PIB30_051204 [Stylosanthes scabra]|uniref:Reverse transcriptase zinc-binding domain-containing protein n=1 Tax=Stylosanthes scabra TaxID=79078 RepID=A0ABU6ZGM9_9FABA|nr:hypothetical protein [Stylosanthes scabra]